MSSDEYPEWCQEEREPTLEEAWEMLSGYIERDLGPLAGQDGTAELWQSFEVVQRHIQPLLKEV